MFSLEARFAEEIIAHAREEAPNECVGILAGKEGRVLHLYRGTNTEHSPYRYSLDPKDLYRIWRDTEAQGWGILAIYHSHPVAAAYFSETDRQLAFWSDAVYIVVSLLPPQRPVLRAFRVTPGGEVTEEELAITPETAA